MKKLAAAIALALGLACISANAQMAPADPSLFQALGEMPGLVKLMDDFVPRLDADPRTAPFFAKANRKRLREQLVDQFCQVSGGPCSYKGADMKSAHANFDIAKGDFNALVEVLQRSMDAQGIPFRAQNQLLAQLAPMHRDVITVK